MKSNHPSPASTSFTGRRYWRSLDELADTPEFKEWLQREFPKGASEFTDEVSRRHFLKIMSASFALAGLGVMASGCRRPEEKLEPFGQQPENYVFGEPQYFATAMPTRTGAIPLVVKSCDGRPVKIEGNAQFPGGNGGTDRYAQASLLDLYDPDRARCFKHAGKVVTREDALDFLDQLSKKFAANQGKGLAFLAESSPSLSRQALQMQVGKKFPEAKWYAYNPVNFDIHRRAASVAFGYSRPVFKYEAAKVIVSLDCDFIGEEDDAHNNIRGFVAGRRMGEKMNRLYAIESLFTLTGANADHRLRVSASSVAQIASCFLAEISGSFVSVPDGIDAGWISECAKDLLNHKGESLVVVGYRQPLVVHLIAHAINSALGNIGKTVELFATPDPNERRLDELAQSLDSGEVDSLVILKSNPVFDAPTNVGWLKALAKARSIVRLAYWEDETFDAFKRGDDWLLPISHYLESWGDVQTNDGFLVPTQPLISPLFETITEIELLARIIGEKPTDPYEIVRLTFAADNGGDDEAWKKYLFNGFHRLFEDDQDKLLKTLDQDTVSKAVAEFKASPVTGKGNLEVIFYRDAKVDDGRHANNGWMQELPDPITKMTWDNAVLISRKTARELGVQNGDVVEIALNGRCVKGPIWTQPGMADYSLGLALGYGREKAGRVGTGVGFNAYKIFSGKYIETGATIKKTGETYTLACTQNHWSMEGRPAVREGNLDEFAKQPGFAPEMHDTEPPLIRPLYPNPLDAAKQTALHQWGMVVDLTACVGCNTCVVACQSENNIPIVGKDQVLRGREMHWIRIDRYYTADPKAEKFTDAFVKDDEQQFSEWIDDVQAVNQPVMCQMCEAAPCENVCPVNATVHDQEGLNVMAYNRCIGTRYCSNNCPYKVRHFNFLDYNKRPLSELKGPIYSTPLTHKTDGKWDLATWWKHPDLSGMREADEWDLIKLSKNPDVSVRMRGVMEKCTYCIQRIEQAKIAQKVKAGEGGDVRLSEAAGTVPKTACQQACPAGAIVFGDISDANSTVSKLKGQRRNYGLLADLLVKPRTSYLARIRNPNPRMPDYHAPFSTEEYDAHKNPRI
jgi:molybdopterin-containing oxidoreductase family iron-sulfur binding subunit